MSDRRLRASTAEKLRKFDSLRGREVRDGEFWDVVAVTAADRSQAEAYELQIRGKVRRKELPLGTRYEVFSDPPGAKIGNGGSTLCALEQLDETYGNALARMRVVLIHAGGFSQRLPSASALGKIFAAVPLGDPLYQMLELKLAMYVDLPARMKPGVLVTCADDIELYSVAEGEGVSLDEPGFTALGHPSPLSVGTAHGVFVLDAPGAGSRPDVENRRCRRFLHKPSVSRMRELGAVCERPASPGSSHSEFVYTDSAYYVCSETAKTLLSLRRDLGPLRCEIDAYGDLLQALGPEATAEYTGDTANVVKEETGLVAVRREIFRRLRGTPLNVVLLNNSKFYHIGTTAEYLFHLAEDAALRAELGLLDSAFSAPAVAGPGGCVMHSILEAGCAVGARSVVEYSRLGAGATVGEGCVVSSCWVDPGLAVPDGVLMHSLCVGRRGAPSGFVTVAFGVGDDLKAAVDGPASAGRLRLCGWSLEDCLRRWGLESEALRFAGEPAGCSLWNARLFPVCPDERSSFRASLEMLQAVLSGAPMRLPGDARLTSMHECLQGKKLEEMLAFRTGLYDDITQRRLSA